MNITEFTADINMWWSEFMETCNIRGEDATKEKFAEAIKAVIDDNPMAPSIVLLKPYKRK